MLRSIGTLVLASVAMMAMAAGASASSTVTIVQDSYTAPDSTPLASHSPNTNLPGGTYQIGNGDLGIGGSVGTGPTSVSDVAIVGADTSFGISLATNGGYTKPTTFTVSADLNLEGMAADAGDDGISGDHNDIHTVGEIGLTGGITLGFYASTFPTTSDRRILGVVYSDTGNLLLVEPSGATTVKVDAVVSTYNGGNPIPLSGSHSLAYTVDTTAETISNVTFDGFAIDFGTIPTGLFTDANTSLVGSYARGGGNNPLGTLDNLDITTQVPEPASMSLLVFGGMAALGLRRRRA